MKKLITAILLVTMALSMFSVVASADDYDVSVAAIDGSLAGLIIWIGQEEGIFEKNNVNVDLTTFTNGMVMMEAIDTWDVGLTGVGGILSGLINTDAKLLNVIATDSGTQAIFVRPDSAIVAAGQGHNTRHPEIYGDADSWHGAEVLCTQGNVLNFLLIGMLDGFGLTIDDVNVTWMDMATSNTSFIAGEGDAACVTGSVTYAADKANYVLASTGTMCDLGLSTATLGNAASLADAAKHEAIVNYMKAYFEVVDWIAANEEGAEAHMEDWCEYCGQNCTPELAHEYVAAETNYTLADNYSMLHDKSEDGDYCVYTGKTIDILKFFIDCGSYEASDVDKLVGDAKVDTSVIDELYNK